jgi:hypothetical protein
VVDGLVESGGKGGGKDWAKAGDDVESVSEWREGGGTRVYVSVTHRPRAGGFVGGFTCKSHETTPVRLSTSTTVSCTPIT